MKIKCLVAVSSFAALQGCIPGSVIGAISDAATGHEGEHCVGVTTKVGDKITLQDGNVATVKSISGASSRCRNPEFSSRALVDVIPVKAYQGKLDLYLPQGWQSRKLTNVQQEAGMIKFGVEPIADIGVTLSSGSIPKTGYQMSDMRQFNDRLAKELVNPISQPILTIEYKGTKAYQLVISGKRTEKGLDLTYIYTVVPLKNEVATIKAWSKTDSFEKNRAELDAVSLSLVGYNQ